MTIPTLDLDIVITLSKSVHGLAAEEGIEDVAEEDKEFQDFIKQSDQLASDRALVVFGAASLDSLLRKILVAVLLPAQESREEKDELFGADRPLSTFSSRINLAYRLGVIDASLTKQLHLVRKVRNPFAHETGAFELNKPPQIDRIRALMSEIQTWHSNPPVEFEEFKANPEMANRVFRSCVLLLMGRLTSKLELSTRREEPAHNSEKADTGSESDYA